MYKPTDEAAQMLTGRIKRPVKERHGFTLSHELIDFLIGHGHNFNHLQAFGREQFHLIAFTRFD